MKSIWNRILSFFINIDYDLLWKSILEVFWLTLIALLPLIINVIIASIPEESIIVAFKSKIIPGEILSYCLSFIAPSLYLFIKLQGNQYKLPFLHAFSIITLLIYVVSVVLYLVTKNGWVHGINLEPHHNGLYFRLTMIFLSITIVFRIYSLYHNKNSTNWLRNRNQQQIDFNTTFIDSLNK